MEIILPISFILKDYNSRNCVTWLWVHTVPWIRSFAHRLTHFQASNVFVFPIQELCCKGSLLSAFWKGNT